MNFDAEDIKEMSYDFWRGQMIISFKSNEKDVKLKVSYKDYCDFVKEWSVFLYNKVNFK